MTTNILKRRVLAGEPVYGAWLSLADAAVAELLAHAGYDFLILDQEHGPGSLETAADVMRAAEAAGCPLVVRVPWNEPVVVKRVLDAGATTVLFPFVQDAQEAAAAVAATRYPPDGIRGMAGMSRATHYGTRADYPRHANREVGVIVQLETADALDRLDEIAAVPGVDALFVGPADLSASMGYVGQSLHPAVMDRMARAARRAAELGKPIGTLGMNAQALVQYRALGYCFVALGADLGLLMQGSQAALQALRSPHDEGHVHTLSDGTVTGASAY